MSGALQDADRLAGQAQDALELAQTIMAASIAMERGEISKDEAKQMIEDQGDDSVVFSDAYPGDDVYDQASEELVRMLR